MTSVYQVLLGSEPNKKCLISWGKKKRCRDMQCQSDILNMVVREGLT